MAPSCILAVKTDLQHTEDMRPVTAIPKAQEAADFKLHSLVVFCDVIRQIRSIDCRGLIKSADELFTHKRTVSDPPESENREPTQTGGYPQAGDVTVSDKTD